jgi:hypothetical protein
MIVIVKTINGNKYEIDVEPTDKVHYFKLKITVKNEIYRSSL